MGKIVDDAKSQVDVNPAHGSVFTGAGTPWSGDGTWSSPIDLKNMTPDINEDSKFWNGLNKESKSSIRGGLTGEGTPWGPGGNRGFGAMRDFITAASPSLGTKALAGISGGQYLPEQVQTGNYPLVPTGIGDSVDDFINQSMGEGGDTPEAKAARDASVAAGERAHADYNTKFAKDKAIGELNASNAVKAEADKKKTAMDEFDTKEAESLSKASALEEMQNARRAARKLGGRQMYNY